MTRLCYDSTTAADVPDGSQLVMGYVDGSTAWSDADWQRFPGRILVRLCIFNNRVADAQVIDIEPGNNDAKGAVPWIREKWLRGDTPTVYCFSDRGPHGYTISDVRSECDAAVVKHPLFLITDFDNNPAGFDPHGDPEIIGKQYANSDLTGGHYDASIVADYWPGVDVTTTVATSATGGTVSFNPPPLFSQSDDLSLKVGEVGLVSAGWSYGDKVKYVIQKVWSQTPGRKIVTLLPPVDPDADPTESLDGQPAIFVVNVSAL